jgi:acetyl coenzyme A synthetase (ADP forming)-like protein
VKPDLDPIFRPKSIAVIGATNRRGAIGREILHNIIDYEFEGKVFPVNPTKSVIHSIKCYSTILDVPDAVDLAVIVVPKELVLKVVDQCGEKGVKGLVTITAGFKETGKAGAALQQKLLEKARGYGMRMIGPNCFGVINAHNSVRLDATFSKIRPRYGKVGFISQSGALGEAILQHAYDVNVGFSMFASIGNKADINSNEIIEYWADDPEIDVILLYLENFGDPRRFTKIARAVTKKKPIIAVKSGTTSKGAAAASSHTGALAGLDVGVDALFEQTGVIRVPTISQMFDLANAFIKMPVPKGNRVAIVTNAGGPGILATDALVNLKMELPEFAPKTVKAIKPILPPGTPVHNPLDLVAGATGKEFKKALEHVVKDPNIDSILTICVPPANIDQVEVADAIIDSAHSSKMPIFACFMGVSEASAGFEKLRDYHIPVRIFPEPIAQVLARLDKHRRWLERPAGRYDDMGGDRKKVAEIIKETRREKHYAIVGQNAMQILKAYGIPAAAYKFAFSKKEAAQIAKKLGFPVVVKVNTPHILHKTETKAVAVDLRTVEEVESAYSEMEKRVKKQMKANEKFSVVVQEMISGGVETVIGMTTDPAFGPLIMFGLGGIYVEVLRDVTFRITPLSDIDTKEMITSLKGYKLLTGYRGSKPVDIAALEDSILRLSQLIHDFPEFTEIDINPFIVTADKNRTRAVDARMILALDDKE